MFGHFERPGRGRTDRGQIGRRRRPRAFTLVELLTVVGIVAILVSMLLPMLANARACAKVAVCATHLRAIGKGWMMYLPANNETFPPAWKNMHWFYGGNGVQQWNHPTWTLAHRPLHPYVALALREEMHAEVFRCPADREIRGLEGRTSPTLGVSTYEYFGNSYMMNYMLLQRFDAEAGRWLNGSMRLADVKIPHGRMVLAGDCQWYYSTLEAPYDANFHNRRDRMNLIFLDGHVSYVQIVRGAWATPDYSFWPWEVEYGLEESSEEQ